MLNDGPMPFHVVIQLIDGRTSAVQAPWAMEGHFTPARWTKIGAHQMVSAMRASYGPERVNCVVKVHPKRYPDE